MTALNVINHGLTATFLTDTAQYDRQGVIVGFKEKCLAFRDRRLAVASAGWVMITDQIESVVAKCFTDIDDVIDNGEEVFRAYHAAVEPRIEERCRLIPGARADYLTVIGGWSKSRQETRLAIFKTQGGVEFLRDSKTVIMPLFDGLISKDPRRLGPAASVEMVKRQRDYFGEGGDSDHGERVVGGHILVTIVGEHGVDQKVVHRWPEDRIGERIQPRTLAANSAAPIVPQGMSRQQRRAWERQQGKKAAA
ncbi:hypothetical protein [Jiella sonneratiae]|uniref:Uncharacterized protein n=1 Tax=Jiella sonneratiae TaxID=2816856 RepID=A0ABS3JA22_9HYPH|nr:hypothetical protein [Jiella sonneratiae]MBO0906526.1 hypothetical protein [Jiella sonneratiae]